MMKEKQDFYNMKKNTIRVFNDKEKQILKYNTSNNYFMCFLITSVFSSPFVFFLKLIFDSFFSPLFTCCHLSFPFIFLYEIALLFRDLLFFSSQLNTLPSSFCILILVSLFFSETFPSHLNA